MGGTLIFLVDIICNDLVLGHEFIEEAIVNREEYNGNFRLSDEYEFIYRLRSCEKIKKDYHIQWLKEREDCRKADLVKYYLQKCFNKNTFLQ